MYPSTHHIPEYISLQFGKSTYNIDTKTVKQKIPHYLYTHFIYGYE